MTLLVSFLQKFYDEADQLVLDKKLQEAFEIYQGLYYDYPNNIEVVNKFAFFLLQLQKYQEALDLYNVSLKLNCSQAEIWSQKGVSLANLKRFEEAKEAFQKALSINEDLADAYSNLALIFHSYGEKNKAFYYLEKAIRIDTNHHEYWCNLGFLLSENNKFLEALKACERSIELKPDFANAHFNKGIALFNLRDYQKALACFQVTLEIQNTNLQALHAAGACHLYLCSFAIADKFFDQVIHASPKFIDAYVNKGTSLYLQERFSESFEAFENALLIEKENYLAIKGCGNSSFSLRKFDLSQEYFKKAMNINPLDKDTVQMLSSIKFIQGHFKEAFSILASDVPQKLSNLVKDTLKCLGDKKKVLFIYCEKNIKDFLLLYRFVYLMESYCAKIILSLPSEIIPLTDLLSPNIEVITGKDMPEEAHLYSDILQLPEVIGDKFHEAFSFGKYLFTDRLKIKKIEEKISNTKDIKVGFVFSSLENINKRRKMINFFKELFSFDLSFYCLQNDITEEEYHLLKAHPNVEIHKDLLLDYVDICSLVQQMDVIICVDDAIAHLAGALGKVVWILLDYNADARWMLDRQDTPWYPSARLFRNDKNEDINNISVEVKKALLLFVQEKTNIKNLFNKANHFVENGMHLHALKEIASIEDVCSNHFDAQFIKISCLRSLGRLQEAIQVGKKCLMIDPLSSRLWLLMGHLYSDTNDINKGEDCYEKFLRLSTDAEELFYLANEFFSQKKTRISIAFYKKATELFPDFFEAHTNMGNCFHFLKQTEDAKNCYLKALSIQPENPICNYNLANILYNQNLIDEAITFNKICLKNDPSYVKAHTNLGLCYADKGQHQSALECYNRAISIDPNAYQALFNRALVWIQQGNYLDGWRDYEYRLKLDEFVDRKYSIPSLSHLEVKNKKIYVYLDQGLGDAILFCRYALDLKDLGAKVTLEVHKSLQILLSSLSPEIEIVVDDKNVNKMDYYLPLTSLPSFFRKKINSANPMKRYLSVSKEKIDKWSKILGPKKRARIGIAWSGREFYKKDAVRSIPFAEVCSIFDLPFDFYCLQKDIRKHEIESVKKHENLHVLSDQLNDFSDTAALSSQMDLVLSVDTSIAHLCGALSLPVWILLPFIPEYRWPLSGGMCPWYSSALLLRQPNFGDWSSLIKKIKSMIEDRFFE